jgi:hypothetical protein
MLMEVWAVFEDGRNILKMGTPASKMSLRAVFLEQPQLNATRKLIKLLSGYNSSS